MLIKSWLALLSFSLRSLPGTGALRARLVSWLQVYASDRKGNEGSIWSESQAPQIGQPKLPG